MVVMVVVAGRSDAMEKSISSRLINLQYVRGRPSDGFTYTLTVWGEERSGGARIRIDLSLTIPVKLALGQQLRSLNTGARHGMKMIISASVSLSSTLL